MPFKSRQEFYEYRKKWKAKNMDKVRAYERNANKKAREELYRILGNKCCKCGFSDIRALQVDHVNGDGYKDRKIRSLRKMLYQVRKNPKRFQMLCANCNWIKRIQNKEYNQNAV